MHGCTDALMRPEGRSTRDGVIYPCHLNRTRRTMERTTLVVEARVGNFHFVIAGEKRKAIDGRYSAYYNHTTSSFERT